MAGSRRFYTEHWTYGDLDVQVDYKSNQHTYLRVKPDGRILVTTSRHTSPEHLGKVVRDRYAWLVDRRERVLRRAAPPLTLWGEPLAVEQSEGRSARLEQGVLWLPSTVTDTDAALESWLRAEFTAAVKARAEHWQPRVVAAASGFRVRRMTSRWGSCNVRTGMVTMNLNLVHKRPALLDYVLVHELTHLHEPSHGPRFKRLMTNVLPEWKSLRQELRQ